MRTIVVGVDGSALSLHALELAADLARDLGAELVVVFARHVYLAMPVHVAEEMYGDVLDRWSTPTTIRSEGERIGPIPAQVEAPYLSL